MEPAESALVAIEPDWNAVQERYLEGEELASIAQDHGTTAKAIAMRAWRYKWKDQQFRRLERDKKQIESEVRGCLTVSCLREARVFQREDPPADLQERDLWGKARLRLLDTASKLFGWDADPLAQTKQAKVLDV